jgi:hypothetical protein
MLYLGTRMPSLGAVIPYLGTCIQHLDTVTLRLGAPIQHLGTCRPHLDAVVLRLGAAVLYLGASTKPSLTALAPCSGFSFMAEQQRIRAVLGFKRRDVPVVLARAKMIHAGLADHPGLFPAPEPPLSLLLDQIGELDEAQVQLRMRAILASERNTKRDALWTTLELLNAHVQAQGDALPPNEAKALFEAAGFQIAAAPVSQKKLLKVRQLHSGAVELRAYVAVLTGRKRGKRVTFHWRYTLDGGATWSQPLSTPVGHVLVEGLPPLATVGFAVSASDANGQGAWTQTVSFIVH